MNQSIFGDDWRACLREQYMQVVRIGDAVTLPTITLVMHEVGFTDDELAELRIRATMRADDMPDDFVPPEVRATAIPGVDLPAADDLDDEDDLPPLPIDEPTLPDEALFILDAEVEDAEVDDDAADADADEEDPPAPDPDGPQQLSLF